MFALTDEDKYYAVENGRTTEAVDPNRTLDQDLHAISIDSKFSIFPGNGKTDSYLKSFPVFPNETVLTLDFLNKQYKACFAVRNKFAGEFRSVRHIVEFIPMLSALQECKESCCIFLLVIRSRAVFVVKRINEYLYFNVEKFENAEELLYHINRVYLEQKLSREADRLVMLGELAHDSRILNLVRSYVKNISIQTDAHVLTEMDSLLQQKA